jgi:hypothetical protein
MNFYAIALTLCASFFSLFSHPDVEKFSCNAVPCLYQRGSMRTLLFSHLYAPGFYWAKKMLANSWLIRDFTYDISFSHGYCCGYYSLNYARCVVMSKDRNEMLKRAVDEVAFGDVYLPLWALLIKNRREKASSKNESLTRSVADLNYDEVQFLASTFPDRNRIIVLDSLQMLNELVNGSRKDAVVEQAFKQAKADSMPIACIINTSPVSGRFYHWFTMALWPNNGDNSQGCIIDVLDSINRYYGPCAENAYTRGLFDLYARA